MGLFIIIHRQQCVNGDRLEIGKWQNSTSRIFKTPKPIAEKLPWLIILARQAAVPNLVQIGSLFMGVFWGDVHVYTYLFFFFSLPSLQVRPLNRSRRTIYQNARYHARFKPLGLKQLKLTFWTLFLHRNVEIWPKKWTVCFLAASHKNYSLDLYENFT